MKIAIIGSGISGIGCAYLLSPHHKITLFEKNNYVGGHANTSLINYPVANSSTSQQIAVDTGFIVYNFKTYHNLKPFFEELEVPIIKSQMSFGISVENGLEYSGKNLAGVFAQKKNIFCPSFLKMLFDIRKFNSQAIKLVEEGALVKTTLENFIDQLQLGEYFKKYYLLPMAAAIWSCPMEIMKNYPAQSFLQFFYNHGLLTVSNQPQWYTVQGGSREYVKRAIAGFKEEIKLNLGVKKVFQNPDQTLTLIDSKDQKHQFDQVIFACHGDQILPILADATNQESSILSQFSYSNNIAVLHRDIEQMPKNKKAWASWVCLLKPHLLANNQENQVSLSYWMNNLQNIDSKFPLFVTLNPIKPVQEQLIFEQHNYRHPIFDLKTIAAQEKLPQIQGKRNIFFCGAYTRYGFHEDGLLSAIKIINQMSIKAKWQN